MAHLEPANWLGWSHMIALPTPISKYPHFSLYYLTPGPAPGRGRTQSDNMPIHSCTQIGPHKRTRNHHKPMSPVAAITVRSKCTHYERPRPPNKHMRLWKRPTNTCARRPHMRPTGLRRCGSCSGGGSGPDVSVAEETWRSRRSPVAVPPKGRGERR